MVPVAVPTFLTQEEDEELGITNDTGTDSEHEPEVVTFSGCVFIDRIVSL